MKIRRLVAVFALVIVGCGDGEGDEPGALADVDSSTVVAATTPTTVAIGGIDDLPEDAISIDPETGEMVIEVGQVADIGGHADAIEVDAPLSELEELWISLGVEMELASCYSAMFERHGLDARTESELAERQAAFTDAQSEEFAQC